MHLTALIEYLTATVAWRTRPFQSPAFTWRLMCLKTMLPVHYPTTGCTRPQVVNVLMIKVSQVATIHDHLCGQEAESNKWADDTRVFTDFKCSQQIKSFTDSVCTST